MDASDAETAFYVAEADKATTVSLRAALIEAGARKFYEIMAARGPTNLTFDTAYPDEQADFLTVTTEVIDAVLDVLAGRVDEWADWNAAECADADDGCDCVSDVQVQGLIAVLRGDTG